MKEIYPDSFYRGIMQNCLVDGYLLPDTFRLDKGRDDGYEEISITWNDDDDAFRIIASQRNERTGDIQFSDGICEIERIEFENRMKPHIVLKNMGYERRETDTNVYHGNILVKENLTKQVKNMIKAQLALLAQDCIIENPYVI